MANVKDTTQVTRVTGDQKLKFAKAAVKLGWPDASALVYAVVEMTIAGQLEIKPPAKQPPTVKFKE